MIRYDMWGYDMIRYDIDIDVIWFWMIRYDMWGYDMV